MPNCGRYLNPSTLANKKHRWQKLVQGECRKTKIVSAVCQVRKSGELEQCNDAELDDLFDAACDDAKMIAAVKFDRGNGNQMRDVGQKSERFANLRKTFAGSNKLSGNQRSQRQQTASSGKFKVFSDVCRECVNDERMQRKDLHTFSKCFLVEAKLIKKCFLSVLKIKFCI